jgi:hypothetical protein
MIESIIVASIVLAAAAYSGRYLYRSVVATHKSCCCTDVCPVASRCHAVLGDCVTEEETLAARARAPAKNGPR